MLTEQIFGKDFLTITYEDLRSFFEEEQEESSNLEFKEGSVGMEKIYKEVCAFLNTEGGVLVIGTPRELEDKQTGRKVCKGDLIPSKFRSGDWLIQKLAGNISPAPVNIKVREFITEKGNFFILDIPQSITPPHQSEDGTYYIRLDKEAKPAPHGLVEALFFKRQKSKLVVNVEIGPYKNNLGQFVIFVKITNESNFPAEKVSYSISLNNIKSTISSGFTNGPTLPRDSNRVVS